MLMHLPRSRLIQMWFALVVFVVVSGIASGVAVTVSTAAMLVALALAPALLVLLLWPGVQPPTASEVMHGTDRRN
jgi:hypothetical protein